MPNPGVVNNELGINAYSGPLGQKEPAYGATERLKQLTAAAPPGTPAAINAPRRARRKAGRRTATAVIPPPSPPPPVQPSPAAIFWQQIAADPGASDLVKMYAAEALSG